MCSLNKSPLCVFDTLIDKLINPIPLSISEGLSNQFGSAIVTYEGM